MGGSRTRREPRDRRQPPATIAVQQHRPTHLWARHADRHPDLGLVQVDAGKPPGCDADHGVSRGTEPHRLAEDVGIIGILRVPEFVAQHNDVRTPLTILVGSEEAAAFRLYIREGEERGAYGLAGYSLGFLATTEAERHPGVRGDRRQRVGMV